MKSKFVTFSLICIMGLGIGLIFINPIQNKLIQMKSNELLDKPVVPVDDVGEASFDFNAVQSINMAKVLEAQFSKSQFDVIGSIAVPAIDMHLPIGKGVSESVLLYGAGTMKPEQMLGEGNYALASHYIEGKDILFGPLYDASIGDSMFVSDKSTIYEYKITVKEVILDTDVQVIYDVPNKTLLTLITCAEQGTKRLLVQGEFVNKTSL